MTSGQTEEEQQPEEDARGIILFQQPIPPCRVPINRPDGSLVLDFPSEEARSKFKHKCISTVARNCEQGARAACSLKAVDTCRGPGWLRWLGLAPRKPWSEIEACEEQAMQACVLSSEAGCRSHAEQFCEAITRPPPM